MDEIEWNFEQNMFINTFNSLTNGGDYPLESTPEALYRGTSSRAVQLDDSATLTHF